MIGVLVNSGAIVVGSVIGLLLRKTFNPQIAKIVMQGLGISVFAMGILGVIKTGNMLLVILSVVIGGVIGAMIGIQRSVVKLGDFLQRKLSKGNEKSTIAQAVVTSTLIFCVGAMVVYGSIEAGLGNNESLYIKAILDGTTSIVLASTLGAGVMIAAIPVLLIEGTITIGATFLQGLATPVFMNELSAIGGVLLLCIGINILEIKQIETADLTPALLGALVVLFI